MISTLCGVQVNSTQDVDGEVVVGVSAHGLAVYKDKLNIYRWPWQKIIHFSYNRGGFSIKVRPQVSYCIISHYINHTIRSLRNSQPFPQSEPAQISSVNLYLPIV